MRRLVQILSVTTAIFACTTVYYGHALWREKASKPASDLATRQAVALDGQVDAAAIEVPLLAQQPPAPEPAACPDQARIADARERLLEFTDAARRQERIGRSRGGLARNWQRIALSIGLSPTELESLLDMLSDQAVRFDERRAECRIDPRCPPCDLQALDVALREEAGRNLEGYLGPARLAGYEAYRHAITERVYIDALRSRFTGANVLDDEKAERLVLALAEERRQFVEQAASRGHRVQVSGAGFNVQDFEGDVAPPPFGPSNWDMTTEYNERIGRVAQRHLSQAQFAAFKTMQRERLDNAKLLEQLTR